MYQKIENLCIKENIKLSKLGLKDHSFGNVSVRVNKDLFFIKPSGVDVKKLKNGDCPLISISTGKVIKNKRLKPSVDMPTHMEIYKTFKNIKSISHCHSKYATAWAQTSKPIPLLGTTQADFWQNYIPLVDHVNIKQLKNYELNTGKLICKKVLTEKIKPEVCPGLIVAGHGQFSWSNKIDKSVANSKLIEFIAETSFISLSIGLNKKLPKYISKFHFDRKHSKKKYYGQA
jgi:L-ribulose-5-phosphate 4-epimerase